MAEKVKAYEDFFASEDTTLVVVGTEGGGEGKSAAFWAVKKRPSVILSVEDTPDVLSSIGYTEGKDEPPRKVVYHMYSHNQTLIDGLREKYNARVVRFARGTE